jgi:hypothetical protein
VRDVHDVGAVEHRDRGRLAGCVDECAQLSLGERREAQAREIRTPELEDPGAQAEEPVLDSHVVELDQREQEPARGRACESRRVRDLRRGEDRPVRERPDDVEPALEGLDEVGFAIDGRQNGWAIVRMPNR